MPNPFHNATVPEILRLAYLLQIREGAFQNTLPLGKALQRLREDSEQVQRWLNSGDPGTVEAELC